MANTITRSKNAITLSAMDSNYVWSVAMPGYPNGVPVFAIAVRAGGTSANTLIVRDGSTTGPIILSVTLAADTYDTYLFGGCPLRPSMLYSECTFTTGALWGFVFSHN